MKSLARSQWGKNRDIYLCEVRPRYPQAESLCHSLGERKTVAVIYNFIASAAPTAATDPQLESDQDLAWLDTMIRKILNVNKLTLRILPGPV